MDESKDVQGALLAEQFKHAIDLLRAEDRRLGDRLEEAVKASDQRVARLEEQARDYEVRLRALQDSATRFQVLAGLATGGGLLSVLTLVRTVVGP